MGDKNQDKALITTGADPRPETKGVEARPETKGVEASPETKTKAEVPKKFKNCSELNKVYPGGVALPGALNAGGTTKRLPNYDKKLYQANKKFDADRDGIVCEK